MSVVFSYSSNIITSYICLYMTVVLTGKQDTGSLNVQPISCMSKYRKHLMCKYKSLPLSSPEELLECSSSEYVSLLLKRFNEHMQKSEENLISAPLNSILHNSLKSFCKNTTETEGESLTLGDVLDVTGKENKVILIEGGPGMGKSTLAIKMCKCWADGELLQEYDAVILLPLRDPEIQAAKSIKDLLLILNEELREEVYREIVKEGGDRVCFMLEGFDELPQQLRSAAVFSRLTEKLPQCTLVYTSRPEACDRLRRFAAHKIEICGFKEKQIDNYINNAFEKIKNGSEKATKLISQVKSNPSIKSILYIPINVAIICHLFLLTLQLPNTLTQLYTLLCLNLILRHINKQSDGNAEVEYLDSFDDLPVGISGQFMNLCFIAYRGRVDSRIIFSSRDIKGYGIDASKMSGLGLLLIAPSTSVYGREKSYNFLHLTLQEFCAAFYVSKLLPVDQLECFKNFKFNENFKMVWKFYSGITGLKNKEVLCHMLPSKLTLMYSYYRGRRTIEFLHYLYEAQNVELCQLVGNHLDGSIFLYGYKQLDVMDCTTVGYLLEQYRGEMKQIICKKCNIGNDCFRILVNSLLSRPDKYSSHFLLDFHDHELTRDRSCSLTASLLSSDLPIIALDMGGAGYKISMDTTLSSSLHHSTTLKELYLNNFGLRPEHMPLLEQVLTNNNTLSVLDVSSNDIGPDGCQHLADVRNTSLSVLIMNSSHIGGDDADNIGRMLYHNKSIRSIDLGYNHIEDDGLKRLVEHLKSNTTLKRLDLTSNDITSIGAGYLKELFTRNSCTINDIGLDYNPLKNQGVDLILQSITCSMEWVRLEDTKMTSCNSALCIAFHKIKGISFTLPANCDDLSDSLANTITLERLSLQDGSDAAYNTIISGVSRNNSIKSLFFVDGHLHHKSVINLAEVIKVNKTITTLVIMDAKVSAATGYILLADAVAVSTSIKNMVITKSYDQLDKSQALQFLKQLKHNCTLKLLVLQGIGEARDDDQFNRDVEMLVEQINDNRQRHGVTSLLYVSMVWDLNEYLWEQVKILPKCDHYNVNAFIFIYSSCTMVILVYLHNCGFSDSRMSN